jgi:mannosyltransferase
LIKFPGGDKLRRFTNHPLVGILTGAAAIRLVGITTRGIQYDDAFSILLAGRSLGEIIQGTAADTMPPLYYFILHFWQKLGTSIAFQRLPGISFSLGIIVFAYLIVERSINKTAAVWTAAILAVSPLQFYHAQDIRMYSLATFLILGWNWAAMELAHEENLRKVAFWKWLVLILCGAGALYCHALAGFGLLAPYMYFLLKRNWRRLGLMAGAGFISLGLYAPWLMQVPAQIAKVQHAFWTPVPGAVEIIQACIMALGDIPSHPLILAFVLFAFFSTIVLCGVNLIRNKKDNGNLLFFFLMTLIPPLCLFVLSYLMRPMFVPRGFLSAYVGFFACMGIIASRMRPVEKYLMGGLVMLCAVLTLPGQVSFNSFPRSPFQAATEYLAGEVKDGDVILHDNKLSYFPARVYDPNLNSLFLADEPGSANDTLAPKTMQALGFTASINPISAVHGSDRVFFVVFQQAISEYETSGGHPVIQKLTKLAGKPVEHTFGDLLILEYSLGKHIP